MHTVLKRVMKERYVTLFVVPVEFTFASVEERCASIKSPRCQKECDVLRHLRAAVKYQESLCGFTYHRDTGAAELSALRVEESLGREFAPPPKSGPRELASPSLSSPPPRTK